MKVNALNRILAAVAISVPLVIGMSFSALAQGRGPQPQQRGQSANAPGQVKKEARLSPQQQQERITQQQQRSAQYGQYLAQRQNLANQRSALLQQQRRNNQYQYQQLYIARLHQQQLANQNVRNYNYAGDPYFYTASNYRYSRDGRNYETNQYGANLLRQAVNNGYSEGYRSGLADRRDRWATSGYKDSYGYQDANYGYTGYYIDRDDYNFYFREGFRRGYDDGYNSRTQYGSYSNGSYSMVGTILTAILNLQIIH